MEAKKARVAINIVTYNAIDSVRKCLGNLEWTKSTENFKVFVFDNDSRGDDVASMVKTKFPWATFQKSPVNTGFSGGHQLALKMSKQFDPDYILILNSDLTISRDAIESLLKSILSDSKVGIVGPLLADGKKIEKSILTDLTIWDDVLNSVGISLQDIKTKKMYPAESRVERKVEVEAITGACMMISKKMIDQTGYFDTDMFMYIEDNDFCLRAREAGWKVIFDPTIKATHSLRQSSMSIKNYKIWNKEQLLLSRFIYFRKHRPIYERILLKLGRLLEMVLRMVFLGPRKWAAKMFVKIYLLPI